MKIITKCSNYASDTCPCVLAEAGHCVVCSMCRGEDFCSCTDVVSYCVMQELINNGMKARDPHPSNTYEVAYERVYDDTIKLIRLKIPKERMPDFIDVGSFAFLRVKDSSFYDVPISVLFEDFENESIGFLIKLQGIKTEGFRDLKKGDRIFMRGPYLNGLQGRKAISRLQNTKALLICREIGLFPSLSVYDRLKKNNNEVECFLDSGSFNQSLIHAVRDLNEMDVKEISICDPDGDLSEEIRKVIDEALDHGVELIHLGLSDYLLKKVISYIEEREKAKGKKQISISCINNARMCCGEGICGSCTAITDQREIVHLCREQLDPREYVKFVR